MKLTETLGNTVSRWAGSKSFGELGKITAGVLLIGGGLIVLAMGWTDNEEICSAVKEGFKETVGKAPEEVAKAADAVSEVVETATE